MAEGTEIRCPWNLPVLSGAGSLQRQGAPAAALEALFPVEKRCLRKAAPDFPLGDEGFL